MLYKSRWEVGLEACPSVVCAVLLLYVECTAVILCWCVSLRLSQRQCLRSVRAVHGILAVTTLQAEAAAGDVS